MSASILSNLTVSINGGDPLRCTLECRRETVYVRMDRAVKPDLSWTFTDTAGHFHAYTADGHLPTVKAKQVHVACDGCGDETCEGYDVTEYHCLACDQIVQPVTAPDYDAMNGVAVPGRRSWGLTVHDVVPTNNGRVSVVVRSPAGDTWFGFAFCTGVEQTIGLSSRTAASHLEGDSELGQMAKETAA